MGTVPQRRGPELAFYVQVGNSLCGRKVIKGTFYTKGTVGVVVPQGQRALFIPSLFFSNTLDISGKFPFLSCSPFYSVPKIEPNHGSWQQNTVVCTPSCMGDGEHQGFKLNFRGAQVMEMTLDHPGISSYVYRSIVLPPQMKPTPLQAQTFKANKFLLCQFFSLAQLLYGRESFSIFITRADIFPTVFLSLGTKAPFIALLLWGTVLSSSKQQAYK